MGRPDVQTDHATKTLPSGFESIGTFDLKDNTAALMQLNLFGFGLFAVSAWVFWAILDWMRPGESLSGLVVGFSSLSGIFQALGVVLLVTAVMIVLHEGVHGFFFWRFTGVRPHFGLRGAYAYAAAPDWYLPKRKYLVVALAPLVVLSLLGVALMAVIPPEGFILLILFLVSNASGAVGDIWVAVWLLRQPEPCFANDEGDAVTLYRFKPEVQHD